MVMWRRNGVRRFEEWLEWESSQFQPLVISILIDTYNNSKSEEHLKKNLSNCLKYLNSALDHPEYLLSKKTCSPNLADLVMWSTLYPLAADKKLASEYLHEFKNIIKWFDYLVSLESFSKVVKIILNGANPNNFKESLIIGPKPLYFQTKYLYNDETALSSVEDNESVKLTEEEKQNAYKYWIEGIKCIPAVKPLIDPILPIKGEKNILITSALPYVNNVPHLGNIIGAVLSADVFARYCRLQQYNTLYICGTDEYGTATETKALEEGVTPKEICDKYFKLHSEIYSWFNISFNYFGRTTTEWQTIIAQDIFWKLYEKQYLIEDKMEQLFCQQCQRFLADRFVEGICPFCSYEDARGDQCDKCSKLINAAELKNPQCKVCKTTPAMRTSNHLFLNLPKLEPILKNWLDNSTKCGEWSQTAKVICHSWLKDGLKPRCITRDLKWGTPVPLDGYKNKVFYVWYDAPIGYLSITANYTEKWEEWWKQSNDVQLYQFMAKDNVPFHSIIFPACQLGTGDSYIKVKHLAAVEYLNYEDTKFSKSRGIGVFGNDARDTNIPSDIWRFYLLFIRPEGQDTSFNWIDLMTKNNSELLNNLGNFINRALTFLTKNFDNVIPEIILMDQDKALIAEINREVHHYINLMEKIKLRDAIRPILNISRLGNQNIQTNKPWELIKGTEEQKKRAGTVMGFSANIACLLANMLGPYMPNTSDILHKQLNSPSNCISLSSYFTCLLPPGHKLGTNFPLFKKIEQNQIEELKKKYSGKQTSPERKIPTNKGENSISNIESNEKIGDPQEIARFTNLVAQQGDKVRQLKLQKMGKDLIDKEVALLLELKKQLSVISKQDIPCNEVNINQKNKKKGK